MTVKGNPQFIEKTMDVEGDPRGYIVYEPSDYDATRPWPLILFLHGAGERGGDPWRAAEVGIGPAIAAHPERFPCVVAMPQCPKDGWWTTAFPHIDRALEETLAAYTIDADRVYLTGMSMGGYGTWRYGGQHTDQFAALLPICGGGNMEEAPQLATLPIWAFHGSADDVVSPDESRKIVEAVRLAGGDVHYTEYPGIEHNSWDETYTNPNVIAWLREQKQAREDG
jgi:predicted peptidase